MKAGFGRLEITPPLGAYLSGYYAERRADGIITPLMANAVAMSDGENTVVSIALDIIGICQPEMDEIRNLVAKNNNIPYEAVFVACTHTHLGPEVSEGRLWDVDPAYNKYLFSRISDTVKLAIEDMKPAVPEYARGEAKDVAFIRRFRMKDGSVRTNPGLNPDIPIDCQIGSPDEEVTLVKLVRENAPDIAIVHFQVHPDVIGGTKICWDWPGYVREYLETALSGEKNGLGIRSVCFNGPQGDTNHINLKNFHTGLEHAKHMARVIAGAVLSVYTYAEPMSDGKAVFGQENIKVDVNKGTAEELAEAKVFLEQLEKNGRESLPGGMGGTTMIAKAKRIVNLADMPDEKELYLTGVGIGGFAIMGLPGEPFTEVGRIIKRESPFTVTLPCCCANGYEGYYPTQDAYDEGGYEAGSAKYRAGTAEKIAEESVKLAKKIKG